MLPATSARSSEPGLAASAGRGEGGSAEKHGENYMQQALSGLFISLVSATHSSMSAT
jgi:hypothetical protein